MYLIFAKKKKNKKKDNSQIEMMLYKFDGSGMNEIKSNERT